MSEQNTSFPFLGEALALDLVNTEILLRGKKHEFLNSPEDAVRWWQEATLQHPTRMRVMGEEKMTQWNETLLADLKQLRSVLRQIFTAYIEQRSPAKSDLTELNRVLALGYQSLEEGEGGMAVIYQTTEPVYGAILLPIALSTLFIITEAEWSRLHKCANDHCIGLFYDTTRSATRQWCSPECMNRARSLQQYRKAKAKKSIDPIK